MRQSENHSREYERHELPFYIDTEPNREQLEIIKKNAEKVALENSVKEKQIQKLMGQKKNSLKKASLGQLLGSKKLVENHP